MSMSSRRRCQTCGRRFTRPTGSSRLNCYECIPSRAADVIQLPATPISDEYSLTRLTKKALEDAGVLMTWQAMAAIRLAELIDSNKHGHSGAAGNVRAHRDAMKVALENGRKKADVITAIFGN